MGRTGKEIGSTNFGSQKANKWVSGKGLDRSKETESETGYEESQDQAKHTT